MSDTDPVTRRIRFFGPHDLAAGWEARRAIAAAETFRACDTLRPVMDVIEIHNILQYVEVDAFLAGCSNEQRLTVRGAVRDMRRVVSSFFSMITDANAAELIVDVEFEYHADLVELLGRNKAYERCSGEAILPVLRSTGVTLGTMLTSKRLVDCYDVYIRTEVLNAPENAEHLVRKHLVGNVREPVFLPKSFSATDAHSILDRYLDSPAANPNYVGLIETAPIRPEIGIDAKLKLKARRRKERMTEEFFSRSEGVKTGCEVTTSPEQTEPVVSKIDGMVVKYSYSYAWLEQTLDYPSILNNFQHLFEFAGPHALLSMPAYPADMGVFERFLMMSGRTDYRAGAAFRATDMSTLLQTRLYSHFLDAKGIDLEEVVAWFFKTYLADEFGASNFSFAPSAPGTSYLQKCRHLFAELESVTAQFQLYVENGELDRELLSVASDPIRYSDVPSLLAGKYVYAVDGTDGSGAIHALFSDQSSLTYISETLKADTAARLIVQNEVRMDDYADHQRPAIESLVSLGILSVVDQHVRIASASRFLLLKSLHDSLTENFYHLSAEGREDAVLMTSLGWTTRRSSLLSEPEADYFNFYLNKVKFSNGPELRNKYLHGSQVHAESEGVHFNTYLKVLRLILAMVIKINDDFCLASQEGLLPNKESH